jgi:hypothetical protein
MVKSGITSSIIYFILLPIINERWSNCSYFLTKIKLSFSYYKLKLISSGVANISFLPLNI